MLVVGGASMAPSSGDVEYHSSIYCLTVSKRGHVGTAAEEDDAQSGLRREPSLPTIPPWVRVEELPTTDTGAPAGERCAGAVRQVEGHTCSFIAPDGYFVMFGGQGQQQSRATGVRFVSSDVLVVRHAVGALLAGCGLTRSESLPTGP
jgi:hypothetical protein